MDGSQGGMGMREGEERGQTTENIRPAMMK